MNYKVTPLLESKTNPGIFQKLENAQPFGSYKIRGIQRFFNKRLQELKKRGLVLTSAGNMAQPAAYFAKLNKVSCKIYIPDSAPQIKKSAIYKLGVDVVEMPFEDIWEIVKSPEKLKGEEVFLHPSLSHELTQGYGSIVDEIILQESEIQAVLVPFGVGGLLTGIARRVKERQLNIDVLACEVETAAPLSCALKKNHPQMIDRVSSFVDAIGTPEVLGTTFDNIKELVKGSIVVSLEAVEDAIRTLYFQTDLVIEGAAGVALAAAVQLSTQQQFTKIATILSGGNLDPSVADRLGVKSSSRLKIH